MRVYLTKAFSRVMRKERIKNVALVEAVRRELGLVQAELGGGLIKQRIARPGQGSSGGYRTVIAYRRGDLAFFLFGFARSERADIDDIELSTLKDLAAGLLADDGERIEDLVKTGRAEKVPYA